MKVPTHAAAYVRMKQAPTHAAHRTHHIIVGELQVGHLEDKLARAIVGEAGGDGSWRSTGIGQIDLAHTAAACVPNVHLDLVEVNVTARLSKGAALQMKAVFWELGGVQGPRLTGKGLTCSNSMVPYVRFDLCIYPMVLNFLGGLM